MTLLEIVHAFRQSLLHLGSAGPRDGALKREADGEQPLDHVVVQVAGDAVAIGEDVELTHPALRGGQLPRQRRLVGEGGHHVELLVGESVRLGRPQRYQDTGDGIGGAQRQHERRARALGMARDRGRVSRIVLAPDA